MNQIDINLEEAWARIGAACRASRVETLTRWRRTQSAMMRSTPRAWCVVLRASDTRINPYTAAIDFEQNSHHRGTEAQRRELGTSGDAQTEPENPSCSSVSPCLCGENRSTADLLRRGTAHWVTIDGRRIRELVRPVMIPWPGVHRTRAAAMLGMSDRSLDWWIEHGSLGVSDWDQRKPNGRGRRGGSPGRRQAQHAAGVWSPSPLDPNAKFGEPPGAAGGAGTAGGAGLWGTMWQSHWQMIPEDIAMRAQRVPRWREFAGRRTLLGWDWICPGRFTTENLTAENAESAEKGTRAASQNPNSLSAISASSAVNSVCGRRVRYLYGPLPVWTLARAMEGIDGPDGGMALALPHECGLAGDWMPGIEDRLAGMRSFACMHCWGVCGMTMTNAKGWNMFVTHISGGLLRGGDVPRPADEAPARRIKRYVPRMRMRATARRQRIAELLMRGLLRRDIARRLHISMHCLDHHTKALYREHGVHSRGELAVKLRFARAG